MQHTLSDRCLPVSTERSGPRSTPLPACPQRVHRSLGRSAQLAAGRAPQQPRARQVAVAAQAQASSPPSTSNGAGEEEEPPQYEVYLTKPLGLRFARGNDGGIYVSKSDSALGSTDPQIKPGDQIKLVSASFGDDVWKAENFGQVMYAIKTRNGQVYLKMADRGGDMTVFEEKEMTEQERLWRAERAGGNYGAGTKERQAENYQKAKTLDQKRRALFETALQKFRQKKVDEALIDFEDVISQEPRKYIGDSFARTTPVYRASQYNVACCYAAIDQIDAGLEALDASMAAGFEQYSQVRSDPNLAPLRASPKFKAIIDKYDEPVINDNVVKAFKSLFSWGKKADDDL